MNLGANIHRNTIDATDVPEKELSSFGVAEKTEELSHQFAEKLHETAQNTVRTITCIDETGEEPCRIDAVLRDSDQHPDMQELSSLVLHTANGKTFDIFADVFMNLPKEVHVFVRRQKTDHNRSLDGTIILDQLETPFDVAVFLHEAGHEWQSTRLELASAKTYTNSANQMGVGFQNTARPPHQAKLEHLLRQFPMLAQWMEGEKEKEYLHILAQQDDVLRQGKKEYSIIEKKLQGFAAYNPFSKWKLSSDKKKARAAKDDLDAGYAALQVRQIELFQDPTCRIKDVVLFPVRLLEYETNERVGQWIDEWRNQGIDMSGRFQLEGSSVSLKEFLDQGIQKTYGASQNRMSITDANGHTFIPFLK